MIGSNNSVTIRVALVTIATDANQALETTVKVRINQNAMFTAAYGIFFGNLAIAMTNSSTGQEAIVTVDREDCSAELAKAAAASIVAASQLVTMIDYIKTLALAATVEVLRVQSLILDCEYDLGYARC